MNTTKINGFKPVSVERYDEMLGVVPPAIMTGRGFLVGEAVRHDENNRPLFAAFIQIGRGESVSYYESEQPMTIPAFRSLCEVLRSGICKGDSSVKIRIGLSIEDGCIQVLTDEGVEIELHTFDKDTYDEADDETRAQMDAEREIVESMPQLIAEV